MEQCLPLLVLSNDWEIKKLVEEVVLDYMN